ncbi:hypothetical protein HII31_01135 [Pseudocercospora fuligena]|uniref:Uncharacterized protein n=1 Tax=Pseudocercospora fuligena TaxID=685502 RepID=A0A8H6VSU7_9PEZI|nr:hypothetical protein HII31_01135 [Pseudocercospora fuligena]
MNASVMDAPDADFDPPPPPPPAPPADAGDAPQQPSTSVTITFRDHRGFEQSFKLKTSTRLGKAMVKSPPTAKSTNEFVLTGA